MKSRQTNSIYLLVIALFINALCLLTLFNKKVDTSDSLKVTAQLENIFNLLTRNEKQKEILQKKLGYIKEALTKQADVDAPFILLFICLGIFNSILMVYFFKNTLTSQKMTEEVLSQMSLKSEDNLFEPIKISSAQHQFYLIAKEHNRILDILKQREEKNKNLEFEIIEGGRISAMSQLSAEVVHEIRNPLNSISLNIEWLENALTHENKETKSTLISISREIKRLYQITESYLVRAKVTIHQAQKTEVNELIQEIISFSKEEDKKKNIEVVLNIEEPIFVRHDRSKLKQAFINVLKNSKEAMPNGGTLSISGGVSGNAYEIRISDTGYGMNEITKRNAFSPFFTTKPNGTGIGLHLTKEIIQEAHGDIFFESQIGKGTVCTVQFPI
jgi:signal transduction histidine kinase